ncbi:EEF1A lysine methyltransferase 1 isoform X1 [Orussus abietinus]|uniref:EEF1A lysine methyltransferase 1 isoform X1 n=1 Tax=Orussus abietinus TaxID=222816 RepID=UPI000C715FEA|nr:EEF1A lysine methyltransferase 1 isoform X1 [Orussus abietinus]
MSESDEEVPQLSAATLAVLQEFYQEREEHENKLKNIVEQNQILEATFEEDWQLSQFWYDKDTIDTFVKGALNYTPPNGRIALVSCPSLYSQMKKLAGDRQGTFFYCLCDGIQISIYTCFLLTVILFEYDQRFAVFGSDYIPFDYKSPLDIPRHMSSHFDLVIADPPFLSEECLTKSAVAIKFLSMEKIVLCTGAIMADLANRLLDLKKCDFTPKHKNNLGNEFWCYSNFNFDEVLK